MNVLRWFSNGRQLVSMVLAYLSTATVALASTIVVTDLSDSLSNLNCDAQCTFREALSYARNGETIEWSSALTYPATTLLAGPLTIDKNLTINGPGAHLLELSAQNLGRVLTIVPPATTVTIDGLALAYGRVQGANGITSCFFNGGLFCTNGLPGEGAAGGCIHSSVAQLNLSRIRIHHCSLATGSGGNGGFIRDGIYNQTNGYPGANGGNAAGGAIYSTGALNLINSSLHVTSVVSGSGGSGGYGTLSEVEPSFSCSPGAGSHGGAVTGAVLYSLGATSLRNVTMIADSVVTGAGGNGGICYDIQTPIGRAQGGNGGVIYGATWAWQGASKASFVTLKAGDYDVGAKGIGGDTVDGAVLGRFVHAPDGTTPLSIHKSIFTASSASDPVVPISYCSGSAITFSNSIVDQACSGATVANPGLGDAVGGAFGITTLSVSFESSLAVNAASDCLDADGNVVLADANGTPRPEAGFCDLGAHEAIDASFKNGFE